ncbi:uncharacterized protein TNCV_2813951 [Trichonephila clavipes]|nr:uncharacterized protein TNCV_2813951 [Trichonephila clavipes]
MTGYIYRDVILEQHVRLFRGAMGAKFLFMDDNASPHRANRRISSFTCRNCGGGDRGRVAIYRPFGEVSLSLNRTVTCMVLKANDRRTSCPCHDEFRGPRSDYVRQVALATTTTYKMYLLISD